MNGSDWKKLAKRFPRVPEKFRMDAVGERCPPGSHIRAHERAPIALAFSPDSRSIAVSGGGLIPGPSDIRVFDVGTRELRRICAGHTMGVFALAFDPRTGLLASASHDCSVILWDLERRDAIFLVGDPDAGVSRTGVAFVGTRILVADGVTFGERATLAAIDLKTGREEVWLELEEDLAIHHLAVAPEVDSVAVVTGASRSLSACEVRVFGRDGVERSRLVFSSAISALAAVDARVLIAVGAGNDDRAEVSTIDAKLGRRRSSRMLGAIGETSIALSPTRAQVAIAHERGVELCSVDSLDPHRRLELGDEKACAVEWSPDGKWVAVGTIERTLRLFEAASGREHLT